MPKVTKESATVFTTPDQWISTGKAMGLEGDGLFKFVTDREAQERSEHREALERVALEKAEMLEIGRASCRERV